MFEAGDADHLSLSLPRTFLIKHVRDDLDFRAVLQSNWARFVEEGGLLSIAPDFYAADRIIRHWAKEKGVSSSHLMLTSRNDHA